MREIYNSASVTGSRVSLINVRLTRSESRLDALPSCPHTVAGNQDLQEHSLQLCYFFLSPEHITEAPPEDRDAVPPPPTHLLSVHTCGNYPPRQMRASPQDLYFSGKIGEIDIKCGPLSSHSFFLFFFCWPGVFSPYYSAELCNRDTDGLTPSCRDQCNMTEGFLDRYF